MKEKNEKQVTKWSKAQIMSSSRFAHQRDVVDAVLNDYEEYTIEDVDTQIEEYMKGGVN